MKKTCINPECSNELTGKQLKYCSKKCERKVQNQTYLNNKKGLGNIENVTLDSKPMEGTENTENTNKNENFKLSILNPGSNMPSPSNDPTVTYFIHDLKDKLNIAIREVDKWQDKAEANQEKIREKENEIADLKRAIEKMEDEKAAKNGLGGLLDQMKDESGSINFEGIGQLIKGASEGLSAIITRQSGNNQIAGVDVAVPAESKDKVNEIVSWFVSLPVEQQNQAWALINQVATNPELMFKYLNDNSNVGSQAAI